MKSIIATLFALVPLSAFASNSDAIKAVLENQDVQNLTTITKIEVVAQYRCPQCFDIVVTGNRTLIEGELPQDAYVKLRTEGDLLTQKINVTVTELSK